MDDFGISEENISDPLEVHTSFPIGSIVIVLNGSRPFPAVVTSIVNENILGVKYYEFEGEFNVPVTRIELLHQGLLTKDDIDIGFAGLCLHGDDQQYYDAVVTKLTKYGVQVYYTQYGLSEEVPIAYLKRKPKRTDKKAPAPKLAADNREYDSLNSSFQPESVAFERPLHADTKKE